jgi:hypothetical protein
LSKTHILKKAKIKYIILKNSPLHLVAQLLQILDAGHGAATGDTKSTY